MCTRVAKNRLPSAAESLRAKRSAPGKVKDWHGGSIVSCWSWCCCRHWTSRWSGGEWSHPTNFHLASRVVGLSGWLSPRRRSSWMDRLIGITSRWGNGEEEKKWHFRRKKEERGLFIIIFVNCFKRLNYCYYSTAIDVEEKGIGENGCSWDE